MTANELARVALPFLWLGMVLAISFLEAPLKFRAPGITVPLGLGIGRLVFRALNLVEVVLAVALLAVTATGSADRDAWILLGATTVVLAVQLLAVRPPLDRRAVRVAAGEPVAGSHLHVAYIALESVKVVLLAVVGSVLAAGMPS